MPTPLFNILNFPNSKLDAMKKIFFLLLLLPFLSNAQSDYKVVFDFTSKDTNDQKAVIRWLNEISKGEPNAKMEVVMYGQGFNLVHKDKSIVASEVMRLAANKNISFKVCAISLKNNN